jgi:spermidine synthase
MQLSLLQRFVSLFVPVRVHRRESDFSGSLELFRYRGRWQLATQNAIYSDGAAYTPLLKAYSALGKDFLARCNSVLVLGTGLGSAVTLLHKKYGLRPQITLLDIDESILEWAIDCLEEEGHGDHVEVICDDAAHFFEIDERKWPLLIIDLFKGQTVPAFATQKPFLKSAWKQVSAGGALVMNYIVQGSTPWEDLQRTLLEVTGRRPQIVVHGVNCIVVARKD